MLLAKADYVLIAILLTQVRSFVNGSRRLGNVSVVLQRVLEHMPVSCMGPHPASMEVNRKTPVNKMLMCIRILFQVLS